MPRVRPPRSDAGRLLLLITSLTTAAGDSASSRSYFHAELVTAITGGFPLPHPHPGFSLQLTAFQPRLRIKIKSSPVKHIDMQTGE